MTDTIDDVAAKAGRQEPVEPAIDEQSVAEQLVAQAREKGIELVGPNGLLSQLTKRVLETALRFMATWLFNHTGGSVLLTIVTGQHGTHRPAIGLSLVGRSSVHTRDPSAIRVA